MTQTELPDAVLSHYATSVAAIVISLRSMKVETSSGQVVLTLPFAMVFAPRAVLARGS